MATELLAPRLLAQMLSYGIPVDRFLGQPIEGYVCSARGVLHMDAGCPTIVPGSLGDQTTLGFSPEVARRMCGRCAPFGLDGRSPELTRAVASLVTAVDMLDEEDEGVGYNGPPSADTWRSVQNDLTQAARAASPYPWLRRWAKPRLDRLALHVERRRMELAALIDTADLERITALPRDGVGTAAERRTAWTAWRARAADAYLINRPSPDADLWSMDRIVKATPNQSRSDVTSQPAVPRTVGIHLSIPSLGEAQHACWIDVDPLSKGEVAVIAAYKIDADWQTGDVTLAVPRCIAEELLSPTRALDATKVPLC